MRVRVILILSYEELKIQREEIMCITSHRHKWQKWNLNIRNMAETLIFSRDFKNSRVHL